MVHQLRRIIASEVLRKIRNVPESINSERLARLVEVTPKNTKSDGSHFRLHVKQLQKVLGAESTQEITEDPVIQSSSETISPAVGVKLSSEKKNLGFTIHQDYVTKAVINDVFEKKESYGFDSDYHQNTMKKGQLQENLKNQTVIVEFSSPNIAKPFHAGHLRSTIIGNFVANINKALGNHVIKINYLGDWGTQFGLLGVGFLQWGNEEEFEKDAINHLFQIYVKANQQTAAEEKESGKSELFENAKLLLKKMEEGDRDAAALWKRFRAKSLEEYKRIYGRLDITFDEYHGESMYVDKAKRFLKAMKDKGLLFYDENGVGYCNTVQRSNGTREKASLIKSDGTTLYLTRDLAAIVDRYKKYACDRIHYVVDNGQNHHFMNMKEIMKQMGHLWIESQSDLHVKFGVVHGMSTRKGSVVFLSDILDEAKQRMMEIMKERMTTKAVEFEETADILGKSAVIIQDLRERRQKGYDFNWERMLQNSGQTGVFLQYCHARICSLEKSCGVELCDKWEAACLKEPEALALLLHIAKFDEIINDAYSMLEAHTLVHYLFQLVNLTNTALKLLSVKNASSQEIAQSRLRLFSASRITLANGMKILGLQPLEAM